MGAIFTVGNLIDSENRRGLALVLAFLWHSLGIGTGLCFWRLAPPPVPWDRLLLIALFEWMGLLPLAVGIPRVWWSGRPKSAVWYDWIGAIPGGLLGAMAGAMIDFIRFAILGHSITDGTMTPSWMMGILLGSAVSGTGFSVYGLQTHDRKAAKPPSTAKHKSPV